MEIKHLLCINGHNERIWSICWSPTDDLFATSGSDCRVKIWRLNKNETSTGISRCTLKNPDCGSEYNYELEFEITNYFKKSPRSVRFSSDGKHLICASFDGTTSIWSKLPDSKNNLENGSENHYTKEWFLVASLDGHENEVKCASFDLSGNYIATCGRDKTIWIYEKSRLRTEDDYHDLNKLNTSLDYFCSAILTGHSHDVKYVCWSPIALLLASASYDNSIKIWTLRDNDWHCIQTLNLHTNTVWCLSFNKEGTKLASCSSDKNVYIYKSKIMKTLDQSPKLSDKLNLKMVVLHTTFPVPQIKKDNNLANYGPVVADDWQVNRAYEEVHSRPIYSVDFGKYLITGGGDNKVKIIDFENKYSNITEIEAHTSDVNAVSWKYNGGEDIFASGGDDEYVRLWKVVNK